MPTRLSANLDLLRAVAVLLVLAQHLLVRFHWADALHIGSPTMGTFGVYLFFVHTCLVSMYSMERSHLNGRAPVENFYIRRIFRIYPLSMIAVLAAVALHLDSMASGITGLSHVAAIPTGRILSNLLLIQNVIKPGSICIWLVAYVFRSWPGWIKFPMLAGLLIAIPIVLYHAVEKPMIAIGIRVAERWTRGAPVQANPA